MKGHGVDCVGLVLGVAKELGIPLKDHQVFQQIGRRPPRGDVLLAYFEEQCGPPVKGGKEGDLLVFWFNPRSRRPHHIAIATNTGMIHTHSAVGQVVEQPYNEFWKKRLVVAYRMPGVA